MGFGSIKQVDVHGVVGEDVKSLVDPARLFISDGSLQNDHQ